MAIGRVNESTLQVFGNDYPTPCVLFFQRCLFFACPHDYQIDFSFFFTQGMVHVYATTYTCSTSRPVISSHLTRSRPAQPRLTIAQHLHDSKLTTWVAGRASAFCRSSKQCARKPDLIIGTTSSVVGVLGSTVLFLKWLTLTTAIRRGDVPDLTADPTLAEKELGFRAKKDLTTMCRDLWNWQTKNPGGYGTD